MEVITACSSYYKISDIDHIPRDLTDELSKWDPVYFRREYIGLYYDKKNKELRIPRGYPESSLENIFPDRYISHSNEVYDHDKINISLTSAPRDYKQEHILAFMLGQQPYQFTRKYSQVYVDLDTGEGKTFCGIAAMCYYQCRGVIFIPAISKIGDQWIDSIDKFTTLKRNEYLYVKGSEMCKKIIKGEYKNVKIFVVPRSTILSFVKKYDDDWSIVERLVQAMNVGIKIIDEAHMDFNTIVNIDCFTNVGKTYYMSSSPSRSEKQERIIYKKVFRDVPQHGKKLKTKEQNHIIPLIIFFKSTPSPEWLKKIKTRYGPSLAKYGEYLLAEDGARDEFLDAYIYALYLLLQFRRRNGKILVICITVDFAKEMQKITKEVFPYLSTGLFVGSGKDKNKELDNDIIFSTTKSMGTGSEIVNHQLTINTITYASEIIADQISGRIRKQENRKAIYCELVNINHKVARDHYQKREPYLIKKAKNGKLLSHIINDNDLKIMNDFFNNKYYFDGDGLKHDKNGRIVINKRKVE